MIAMLVRSCYFESMSFPMRCLELTARPSIHLSTYLSVRPCMAVLALLFSMIHADVFVVQSAFASYKILAFLFVLDVVHVIPTIHVLSDPVRSEWTDG